MSPQTRRKTGRDNWQEVRNPVRSLLSRLFGHSHIFVTCSGQGTVPGSGATAVDKSDKNPCSRGGAHFLMGKTDNKQINKESLLPAGCCFTEKVQPSHLLTTNL